MLAITLLTVALSGPPISLEVQPPATTATASQDPQDLPDPQDQTAETKAPPTPPHTGIRALFFNLIEDVKHLPSKQNALLLGVGAGLAAAAHPADQGVNVRLRSHQNTATAAFAAGKYVGDTPVQAAFSLGTYAYGRIFKAPKVAHLGNDLLQAQILTVMIVHPLKSTTHRQRPDASNDRSFPSGHAAVTFATATVIERHLGWRKSLVGYGIASYVAASRLHDNRHHLSDVVFGATVGAIVGRTVVHHTKDYWAWTPVAVPGGGVAVLASRTY